MTSLGALITIGMGSSSFGVEGLATDCANFHLEEENAGGMEVVQQDVDRAVMEGKDFRYCLVGRFLTEKSINFLAMKNTSASVWEPGKGINITKVGSGRFLFPFFHEVDVMAVLSKGHGPSITIS